MPKIETWDNLPLAVREHLIQWMLDRSISLADLNQLRLWVESKPEVPDGDWYKDFGSFKICGKEPYPKTFLLRGQAAKGGVDLTVGGDRGRHASPKRAAIVE